MRDLHEIPFTSMYMLLIAISILQFQQDELAACRDDKAPPPRRKSAELNNLLNGWFFNVFSLLTMMPPIPTIYEL